MRYILLFSFLSISFLVQAQNETKYIEDYLTKWKNSEQYLVDIINKIPEDKINFKPADEGKSFHDICLHMVSNMVWLSTDYLNGGEFKSEYKNRDLTKEQLIDIVQKAFAFSTNAIEKFPIEELYKEKDFFSGPMNTMQILRLMNDHLSHHRGQLTVHLRINNLPIPRYVGW